MNRKIEFILSTSTLRFEAWFDQYRLTTLPFAAILENGNILHAFSSSNFKTERRDSKFYKIDGNIALPPAFQESEFITPDLFNIIELEVFQYSNNKIFVKLNCKHLECIKYYLGMLEEIARVWPEVSAIFQGYITQFMLTEQNKKRIWADVHDETFISI